MVKKVKEVRDELKISDNVSVVFVRGPFRALKEAIEHKRWFEGITMSGVFIERFAADKLKEYFHSKQVPMKPKRIARLGYLGVIDLLLDFGIIDNSVHSKMVNVRRERNRVLHEEKHPDTIGPEKATIIIEKAMECLKVLGVT